MWCARMRPRSGPAPGRSPASATCWSPAPGCSPITCSATGPWRPSRAFVLPDLDGAVVVHDRYQNYDAFPGLIHQLCAAHLLRDLADAAQTYPDAHWPVQITQALQGLIHAANIARAQGLAAVPDDIAAPLDPRVPARRPARPVPDPARPRPQAGTLPGPAGMPARPARRRVALHHRPAHPAHLQPGRTRRCARPRPSRRSPAGSGQRKPPGTGTPSAATSPPPPSTAPTS